MVENAESKDLSILLLRALVIILLFGSPTTTTNKTSAFEISKLSPWSKRLRLRPSNSKIHSSKNYHCNCLRQQRDDAQDEIDATDSSSSSSYNHRRCFDPDLIRYRCRVAYDGTRFCGFQIQQRPIDSSNGDQNNKKGHNRNHQRTVQDELEIVLSKRFNRSIRVVGAGRTDAGVHARGQAVHFDLLQKESNSILMEEKKKSDHDSNTTSSSLLLLQTSMNRMLPSDVRVWNVQMAPEPCLEIPGRKGGNATNETEVASPSEGIYAWNVMQKATGKLYSYRICIGDSMDPLLRHSRWQIPDRPQDIDPSVLKLVLKEYEGTHDFKCFAGALEQNARKSGRVIGTVRTIHCIDLIDENPELGLYRIDIYLDGALYKMVRNLVGTAIDVCRDRLAMELFQELLHNPPTTEMSGRKRNPCKPAPPQGLTLECVYFDDEDDETMF